MNIPFRFTFLALIALAASSQAIAAAPDGMGQGIGQGGLGFWTKTVDNLYHNNPAVVTASCNSLSQGAAQAGTDVARTWGGGYARDNSYFCSVRVLNYTSGYHEETWVYTPGTSPNASLLGGAKGNASTDGYATASCFTGNCAALVGGYAYVDCSIMPLLSATLVAVSKEKAGTLANIEWTGPNGGTIYLTVPQGTTTDTLLGLVMAWSDEYRNSDGIEEVDVVTAMTKTGILTELYADEDAFLPGHAQASYHMSTTLNLTLSVL